MIYQVTLGGPRAPKIRGACDPSMSLMRLLGPQVAFQDRLGAYFWSSKFDLDFFTAILLHLVGFYDCFGLDFGGVRPRKSLIFIERVVIFEVFLNSYLAMVWGLLRWPLGPFGGSLGTLFGPFWRVLGPLGAILGSSWGLLLEFLRASWAAKRPRCFQDGPRSLQKAPKHSPKASKMTSQTSPRGFLEAFNGCQERVRKTTD